MSRQVLEDLVAQPLRQIQGGALERRRGSRRRFKYWRRHTPHFYLALTAIAAASLLSVSDGIAFLIGGFVLCGIAFAMTGVTAIAVFSAYFWGFFMVMNGNIPLARIKVFIPHAVVGSLSPLVYMLNLSLLLDSMGSQTFPGSSLLLAVSSLALLLIQFLMGRTVVHVERPRLLKLHTR